MGKNSKIEWTHHTFNPWWGCTKTSPGCRRCYATQIAHYVGLKWGSNNYRYFGDKHWNDPIRWNRKAGKLGEKHRVFCGSMCDIFEGKEEHKPHLERLWEIIENTPNLIWLLLTKRPENISKLIPAGWNNGSFPRNVWLGATVEDEKTKKRIKELAKVPAATRFISCEPMIEPPDVEESLGSEIHWVIVGGETGAGSISLEYKNILKVYQQCKRTKTPFFFKQWGGTDKTKAKTRILFGRTWDQFPE